MWKKMHNDRTASDYPETIELKTNFIFVIFFNCWSCASCEKWREQNGMEIKSQENENLFLWVSNLKSTGREILQSWFFMYVSFFKKLLLLFIFLFNLKIYILISIFHIQQYMPRFLIYIQNSRIEEERKWRKQTQERHYHHHHQNQCTISQSESTILWKRLHLNLIVELKFYWFIQIASVMLVINSCNLWIINETKIHSFLKKIFYDNCDQFIDDIHKLEANHIHI